ncbi:MAG: hypothetical protein H7240_03205 [Glaciimonas sp.]|nr:hypothetical protein [Glaciimonas sp.]
MHAILFTLVWHEIAEMPPPVRSDQPNVSLKVTFLELPKTPSTATSVPSPKFTPLPPKQVARPKVAKQPKLAVRSPAARPPTSQILSASSPIQAIAPSKIKPAPPEMDMSTMLNAARDRRLAEAEAEGWPDPDPNAQASNHINGPPDNAVALANIQFLNQHIAGGGGTFQIMSKGSRIAKYAFRGWGATARENRRQLIEVDAGPDGDIDSAIVKSMIALIRKRYPGNFKWDSQRLGRLVELSARETDGPALEAFLMKEFFGGF